MNNYNTIKFNGNLYPYTTVNIYDYNKNTEIQVKVSTTDLQNDLINALTSKDNNLVDKANNFNPDFKIFIPKNILLKYSKEQIQKYVDNFYHNQQ